MNKTLWSAWFYECHMHISGCKVLYHLGKDNVPCRKLHLILQHFFFSFFFKKKTKDTLYTAVWLSKLMQWNRTTITASWLYVSTGEAAVYIHVLVTWCNNIPEAQYHQRAYSGTHFFKYECCHRDTSENWILHTTWQHSDRYHQQGLC